MGLKRKINTLKRLEEEKTNHAKKKLNKSVVRDPQTLDKPWTRKESVHKNSRDIHIPVSNNTVYG